MKLRNAVLGISMGIAALAYAPGLLAAQEPWAMPPGEYQRDVQRQGFHDGVEGARKDFQNHRRPNVNNRDEYRHPRFSGPDRHDYREAFRQGYETGVQHLYNGGPR
jgi:hypothetical protein